MTTMTDTESDELPPDNDGANSFDITLYGSNVSGSPWLGLSIPMRFIVPLDDGTDAFYNSGGVLSVDLDAVLREYMSTYVEEDGGETLLQVAAMLRKYATAMETAHATLGHNVGNQRGA